jgi:hypothetical protein
MVRPANATVQGNTRSKVGRWVGGWHAATLGVGSANTQMVVPMQMAGVVGVGAHRW